MDKAVDPLPSFSVVVATHGRPRQLAGCLAALADLDYPHDRFEVLVVDDGSPARYRFARSRASARRKRCPIRPCSASSPPRHPAISSRVVMVALRRVVLKATQCTLYLSL